MWPQWMWQLANVAAYHLGRGVPAGQVEADLIARFRARDPELVAQAVEFAEIGLETAARARQLGPDQPLQDALAGLEPPTPEVTVRVVTTWEGPTGQSRYRTINVTVPWNMTMSELQDVVTNDARFRSEDYPGWSLASLSISGSLLGNLSGGA